MVTIAIAAGRRSRLGRTLRTAEHARCAGWRVDDAGRVVGGAGAQRAGIQRSSCSNHENSTNTIGTVAMA
jgi:hypothetical protein